MDLNNIPKPTESELEILQILWLHGPSSVRFVNEKLNEEREVGYTTTLKLMQIMVDKGLALRNTESRTHIYQAAVSEADTQKRLLQKFVDTTFRGSAMKLVMQALGNHQASPEELDEIKALIEKMESGGDDN
ncbi:MAG: BlaI/MecI/CopY family transcriptional regulator [Phaeodactylibacter sp.]|nr:BlaI/MecI/CopY family transcriptional regulator [Phaeodactylibacter sp.]MCB9285744.1 BlaI/MecI/CopY family transcriptional regulator [Lewinellaceae bacterium]